MSDKYYHIHSKNPFSRKFLLDYNKLYRWDGDDYPKNFEYNQYHYVSFDPVNPVNPIILPLTHYIFDHLVDIQTDEYDYPENYIPYLLLGVSMNSDIVLTNQSPYYGRGIIVLNKSNTPFKNLKDQ